MKTSIRSIRPTGFLAAVGSLLRRNSRRRRGPLYSRSGTGIPFEVLEQRIAPTTFYYESFEAELSSAWTLMSVDAEARVAVRDLSAEGVITNPTARAFTQNGNNHALAFDSTRASGDSAKDLGIAVVQIDLTGMSDGILTYHHFEGGDNNDVLPDQHSLTTQGDGISISRDGATWYRLMDINGGDLNRGGDSLWQMHEIDLGSELSRINSTFSAGLSFDSSLRLKFSQYDSRSLPTHGWAIDEIRIQDQADNFTLDRPRGAFHRFNLAGENDTDFYFRAAVYGTPDASTPIVINVHGSGGDNQLGETWLWNRFVSDPANGINSLIVMAPAFVEAAAPGRFNTPVRYTSLSWNTSTNAAADLVLLDAVDSVTSLGIGDGNGLRLWGFSAGGQFVGRFTAAHPDRVAATVVGGPSSQILPDEDITYQYGFGANPSLPAPPGISLSVDPYLQTRIMFWVGQDDDDPNHPQLGRSPSVDSVQGITRRQRAINQFEAVRLQAADRMLNSADFEYELFISEGDGHGWGSNDVPGIFEFMMRGTSLTQAPINVFPRIVRQQSSEAAAVILPQHVDKLNPGEEVELELWVESPAAGGDVSSGTIDMFFEPDQFEVLGLSHGVFSDQVTGSLDAAAGRIRGFGGQVDPLTTSSGRYLLFGRIRLKVAAGATADTQAFLALQRFQQSGFQLSGGVEHRTDLLPLPRTMISPSGVNTVQGLVFADLNGDGNRQPTEPGLAGRTVLISASTGGSPLTGNSGIEPDNPFGSGAYLQNANPLVTLSALGSETIHRGIIGANKSAAEASTGTMVFATRYTGGGSQTIFTETTRQMRMDFHAPTTSVSLDVIGLPGTSNVDRGQIRAYNSNGVLVDSAVSQLLVNGQRETLNVSSATGDIAYVIASAADNQTVRLDNLLFSVLLTTTTDSNGFYRIDGVSNGAFYTRVVIDGTESVTSMPPAGGRVNLAGGQLAAGVNFGISGDLIW
ncbi:MAG: hypothetical protein R3C49_01755 [Planctomycetaceae bacterium]